MNCFCFLLLLAGTYTTDTVTYDLPPFGEEGKYADIRGKVLSVTEQEWAPPPGVLISDTLRKPVAEAGLVLRYTEAALRDSSSRLLSLTFSETAGKKTNTLSQTFYYSKNRRAAVSVTKDGTLSDSVAFHYNRDGLVSDYRRYNGREQLVYKVTYTYKQGRFFMVRKKNSDNFPVAMIRYRYDGDRLSETQHFNEQQQLAQSRSYSSIATPEGNRNNSCAVKDGAGNLLKGSSRIEDSLGRLLELNELNAQREVTTFYRCAYNEHGFPEEEEERSAVRSGISTSYYLYDDRRNWIRRDVFTDGKLSAVFLRTIEYAAEGS